MLKKKDLLYFKNKKIIITGHTGFKGSWLSIFLSLLGSKVYGISKDIPSRPSHFTLTNLRKKIYKSSIINLNKKNKIRKIFKEFKPDIVFHLAAQSLVSKSYSNPLMTWETNTIGTINILEILKDLKKKTNVIFIYSDKVYRNKEVKKGYKEGDELGGLDPYGASKAAAEIAIRSYVKSFFNKKDNKVFISIARAGNVIGGGDWSKNRLIPDCMRSWLVNKSVVIRNPNSTRPWQHILDVLYGYIILAINLNKNKKKFHGEAFNFGPNKKKNYKVIEILKIAKFNWPEIKWSINLNKKFKENQLLNLNSDKALRDLNWSPKLTTTQSVKLTVDWYKEYLIKKNNLYYKTVKQINFFKSLLK